MRFAMLSSLLLIMSLSGCGHVTTEAGVRTVHDYCLIASGISYASQPVGEAETVVNRFDTAETVAAVEKHNVVYERTCPSGR